MIKRFFTYMAGLMLLAGCTDDFIQTHPGLDENGDITIEFANSPLKTVVTRADETVSSVVLYAFKASDETFLDSQELPVTGNKATYTPKSGVATNKNDVVFYFTSNIEEYGNLADYTALTGKTTDKVEVEENVYTMSSKGYSYSDLTKDSPETVALVHNGVKVSVTEAGADGGYDASKQAFDFCVAGAAEETSVMIGGSGDDDLFGSPSSVDDINNETLSSAEKFVHATSNTGSNEYGAFVIVKAQYQGMDYYYRLDFKEVEGTGDSAKEKAFDLKPNHWYQFLIKRVFGPGYKDPQEAMDHPAPMIWYDVHDHSPKILNMISDGNRELGVSHSVTRVNDAGTESLFIKLYSKVKASEESELSITNWNKYILIPSDCKWLTVESIGSASTADAGSDGYSDDGIEDGDSNDKGTVYDVKLKFIPTNNPGELETVISVVWQGLVRNVTVKWDRTFDASSLFSNVQMRAYSGKRDSWVNTSGDEWSTSNYFGQFLKTGTVGVSKDANNGDARDDGFHFPVMYGSNKNWTYMYEVTLKTAADLNGGNKFYWKVESDGNVSNIYFPGNTSGDSTGDRKFYISRSNGGDDYDYQEGELLIYICSDDSFAEDKTAKYTVNMYHTGFFHKDKNQDGAISGSPNTAYTYYEVISAGSDHWLDRNIGAASANDYVEGAGGNSAAAGYYLVCAKYVQYGVPQPYTDLIPPGYDVPTVDQWDNLRNSTSFRNELSGSYYSTCLTASNGKRVYFPKARYKEGGTLRGENRAGYYWTKDAAFGTEKEETGNWLRSLVISGNSSSYVNGKVKGKDTNPYFMSLRAVTSASAPTYNRVSFFVDGATHVFLYTLNGNEKQPVTTWPGQSLGTYETMREGQAFNFTYDSTIGGEFYVVFNYVGADNRIYTMSKNNFATDAEHYAVNLDDIEGWKVNGSNKNSDFGYTNCKVTVDANPTGNGTTWKCTPTGLQPNQPMQKAKKKYRLYWQRGRYNQYAWNWKVYDADNGNVLASGDASSNLINGDPNQYWCEFELEFYPHEFLTKSIVPEFSGNETIRKSYNQGRIPIKLGSGAWFKEHDGYYSYGQASDGQQWEFANDQMTTSWTNPW